MYQNYGKRVMDILLSGVAAILFFPIMIIIAFLVRINLGSPIIFKQERPGKDEKIFTLYKFRTMRDDRDLEGNLKSDKERLTKFGKFLRSTSLDELPELLNILKGDMSIVGPRPLATIYLPFYNEDEKRRHCVRPGLTGLAQINGRNSITWEEKFAFDIKYVENITFIEDMKIIIGTLLKVLKRSDIGQADKAPESFHIIRAKQIEKEV